MSTTSVTAAVERDHLVVLFEDDVLVIVEVEQADRVEFVWHAARRVDRHRAAWLLQTVAAAAAASDAKRVDDALHRGVVRRMLVLPERERTDAAALVGVVALGRYDPAGPADPLEVDVHLVPLAGATAPAGRRAPAARAARTGRRCVVHGEQTLVC